MRKETINTGKKFFGAKVLISSSGDPVTDGALKEAFNSMFWLTGTPADNWAVRHLLGGGKEKHLFKETDNA